jgi:uncharacterized DUF497 family protein
MDFEWDSDKAETNERKHGVPFPFATRVFLDENRLERYDSQTSYGEDRWITIGLVDGMEIMVAYTVRRHRVRIISARKVEHHERQDYWNR